jgi:hypothetical protein
MFNTGRSMVSSRTGAGALALLALACGGGDAASVRTIDKTRVVESSGAVPPAQTTSERLGVRNPRPANTPMDPSGVAGSARPDGLAWDTPAGWTALKTSSMRVANFRVAGDERAECYLTLLGGDGGGLAANVNRWRTQMGQPPLPASEIAALPKAPMFGREAALVRIQGTFSGMGDTSSAPDYLLVGLLLVEPAGSAFLKMTGPESVVAGQLDAFLALARSLRIEAGGVRPGDVPSDGALPEGHPPIGGGAATADAPKAAPTSAAQTSDAQEGGGFAWKTPEGWRRGPDKSMRVVTYYPAADERIECYVTALGGDAGGALANANRWRGQLGAPALTQDELAKLPRVPMLGAEAVLVEATGKTKLAGGGAEEDAAMLATTLNRAQGSVFVKMTGPPALVAAEKQRFLAFCATLVEAR